MFVYTWKDPEGVPFYVGATKRLGRTNPKNNGNRNWLCKKRIAEIGVTHVVIEIVQVESIEAAQELECALILKYGRVQLDTGTLTNLREGGGGTETMSPEGKERLRVAMLDPNHPCRSEAARVKQRERM